MKALALLLCLLVAACADLETKPWFRVDGTRPRPNNSTWTRRHAARKCRDPCRRRPRRPRSTATSSGVTCTKPAWRGSAIRTGTIEGSPRRQLFRAAPRPRSRRPAPRRQLFRAAQRRPPFRAVPCRQPLREAPCRRSRPTSRRRATRNAGRLQTSACGCRSARDRGVNRRAVPAAFT